MHSPSSKYLSRQPAILKGLSLNELCFVVVTGISLGAISGVMMGLMLGFIAILGIAGVLIGGFVGYFVLSAVLVKLKGDAPNALLKKRAVIALASAGLIQNPYQHYEGVWLKSKKVKG
ncbi:TPA: DUF3487 family protein [Legionella pneumophila]|nr:DUF3487 family protein [Legionella pneumophila]HBD7283621.1 DUF3487 family protein [Legionella pneumophila]HBD9439225.1 DUF3487 family protein [Legionella pneumophila]HEN8241140.1 DUF3487 family protein [Legionella pneumophila]